MGHSTGGMDIILELKVNTEDLLTFLVILTYTSGRKDFFFFLNLFESESRVGGEGFSVLLLLRH